MKPAPGRDDLPLVTVLVPARNEERFIGSCLDSLSHATYPVDRLEVLVLDGRSEDRTRDLVEAFAREHPWVRLIDNPDRITPTALNIGIREARGTYIVWIGSHNVYVNDYVEQCVIHAIVYEADHVGGAIETVARDPGLIANLIVSCMTHPFGVGPSHFRLSGQEPRWVDTTFGGCYHRRVFARVGGFNERLARGQDLEFHLRLKQAGFRTLLVPRVRSQYFARTRLGEFLHYYWINGVWAVLPFLYSSIVPVGLRHLVPMAFAGGLLFLALVGSMWSPAWWLAGAILALYAALALAASCQVAWRRRDLRYAVLLPLVFLGFHLAYGLGSLWGGVRVLAGWLRGVRSDPTPGRT